MKFIYFGDNRGYFGVALAAGLAWLSAGCGAPPLEGEAQSDQEQIEDGAITTAFPSVGFLTDTNAGDLCAATMLSSTVAVTAKHCVEGNHDNMKLVAGYSAAGGWVDHPVDTFLYHPGDVDLMLIHLATPMFTDPANISGDEAADFEMTIGDLPNVGDTCTAVGYGVHHDTPIDSLGSRNKRFGYELVTAVDGEAITLAEGTGLFAGFAAGGDSGGPLICNNHLVAINDLGPHKYPITAADRVVALGVDNPWLDNNLALAPAPVTDSLYTVKGDTLYRVNQKFGNFKSISGPPSEDWSGTTSMAASGGYLYAVQSSYFTKIDPTDNPVNGRYQLLGNPIWDGPTLMTSLGSNIYITKGGSLWSIDDLSTGAFHKLSTAWTGAAAMTTLNGLIYIIKNSSLYAVDPTTGVATHVGGSNWAKNSPSDSTLLAAVSGKLYVQNNDSLYRIDDLTTGAFTSISGGWTDTYSMAALDGSLFLTQSSILSRFSVVGFGEAELGSDDWSGPTLTVAMP